MPTQERKLPTLDEIFNKSLVMLLLFNIKHNLQPLKLDNVKNVHRADPKANLLCLPHAPDHSIFTESGIKALQSTAL